MNLNISEHIAYNQYKEKLNEIYDKLDEVIYLSNTIDYKKITILLAEIVQNFDYYKHHEEALAALAANEAEATSEEQTQKTITTFTAGGGKGDGGGDEPNAPAISHPYSLIDDKTIDNIKDGEEYKRLRSYIEKTKTRIDKKGEKILELVKTFLEIYFKQLNNDKMNDDFIKQENNLDFKLNDIIANIDRIEHGIHDESKEEAKIYVDLMSNQWRFKWRHNSAETILDEFVGTWYRWYKKPFVKNAHVINKPMHSITKEDYTNFVEDKLYTKLFFELHKGFEPPPINQTKTFDTIKVLFETNLKEVKEKIKIQKEAEAIQKEAETEAAVGADDTDAVDDTADDTSDTEKAKQSTTPSIIIPKPKQETGTDTEPKAEPKPEQPTQEPTQETDKVEDKPIPTPKPDKTVEEKTEEARARAMELATIRREAKAEATKIAMEAKIKAAADAKKLAEKTKADAEANATEIAKYAQDKRNDVLKKRDAVMSIVPGLNPDGTPQLNGLLNSTTKLTEETMGEANKLKESVNNTKKGFTNAANTVKGDLNKLKGMFSPKNTPPDRV